MTPALFAVAVLTAVLAMATAVAIVRDRLWELAPLVLALTAVSATATVVGLASLG